MEGIVKWYNQKKGYGFITGDDGVEYFIHHSAVSEGTFLRDNDKVSFEAAETEKGKQAQNVTLLQKASEMGPAEDAPAEEPAEEVAEEPAAEEEAPVEEPAEEEVPAEEPAEEKKKEE